MRRNVLTITLALIMFAGGVFAGIDIQRCKDAVAIGTLEQRLADMTLYAGEIKGTADHYKFYLDKMCYDNEKAKANIERLLEACDNITRERDIYYNEIHKLLNPPDY